MKKIKKHSILALFAIILLNFASCEKFDGDFALDKVIDEAALPEVSFTASETSIIEGESITFTDTSTKNPLFWNWSLDGADVTSSNDKNITVRYQVPGVYDVKLKVRNESGAKEIILEDYITVEGQPIPYVSLYEFDGNLEDAGSNAITAVSNFGSPTYVEDRNSIASSAWLSPKTADNWLTIPNYKGIAGDGQRTVMARFRTNAGTSRKTIVSWGTNASGKMFNVMIEGGQVRIEAGASSLRTERTDLMDGQWHHIAVTFDPTDGDKLKDVKIFIDGVSSATLPDAVGKSFRSETTVINTDATSDVRIGNSIYSSHLYFFNGEIDDVAILDELLIPIQIAAISSK
ncbi:LamG-like jellyroll fold domain-containing protein [Bacteroidota bacterium]